MDSKKDIQYINLIKIEQNVKLDSCVFTNGKLIKSEQSIFLLENNQLSEDVIFKIKVLENKVPHSFTTAICEDITQKIVNKNKIKSKTMGELLFDTSNTIVLDKSSIEKTKSYYNSGNIDYIISPFTILHNEIMLNSKANSLNLFIFNNTIYAIYLNEKTKLGYSSISTLTPYVDIKKSNFYTNEVAEQILYDEIYLLEIEESINTILEKYYEASNSSNFCENVNIFYVIKHLENKDLETLKTNLSLNINYNPININDAINIIVRRENIKNYSFTKKRTKKSKSIIFIWFLISITITVVALYGFNFLQSSVLKDGYINFIKQEQTKKIENIDLPNHIALNQNTINLIINLFDTIDDNSLLKEIQIAKNESTIVYDFKAINPFEKTLKPKLLKFYERSENIITTEKKGTFTSNISNVNLLIKAEQVTKKYIPTINKRFLSTDDGKKGIEQLFNNNATVKLVAKEKDKFVKYTYDVSTILKTPTEFFDTIKLLEKQNYSIVLDYPIDFSQTNKGLEIHFKLIINQNMLQDLKK